jgi:hypothetical protein
MNKDVTPDSEVTPMMNDRCVAETTRVWIGLGSGLHLLPGYCIVAANGREVNQALIIVKAEIPGHRG